MEKLNLHKISFKDRLNYGSVLTNCKQYFLPMAVFVFVSLNSFNKLAKTGLSNLPIVTINKTSQANRTQQLLLNRIEMILVFISPFNKY